MGFYPLWRPPLIPPHLLASNVRKYHLPIRFRILVILRRRYCNQLHVHGYNDGHSDHLSLALWEGSGAFL